MKKRQKVSIWYVLLGIWIVLILQNFMATMFAIKTIPYSEFLKLLKEKKSLKLPLAPTRSRARSKRMAPEKNRCLER